MNQKGKTCRYSSDGRLAAGEVADPHPAVLVHDVAVVGTRTARTDS